MQWIAQSDFEILIHWIAFYSVDSAIQLLSNWGLTQMFIIYWLLDVRIINESENS